MRPGVFDDDRLLACALGLDDDPELLSVAEDDAVLAARLAAMRADVATLAAQVSAAVPTPDETYADLADDRWSGLKEYLEPPARAARPRRAGRWWRVAVPVAALVALALVVGIVAVDRGSQPQVAGDRSAAMTESVATNVTEPSSDSASGAPSPAESLAAQLNRFAVVVLARARAASGALQRFTVLRIFKGEAPRTVELVIVGQPADPGRLHLLMLDPVASGTEDGGTPEAFGGQPPATTRDDGGPRKVLIATYTYHGEPTVVRELAADTDPDKVSLPIP